MWRLAALDINLFCHQKESSSPGAARNSVLVFTLCHTSPAPSRPPEGFQPRPGRPGGPARSGAELRPGLGQNSTAFLAPLVAVRQRRNPPLGSARSLPPAERLNPSGIHRLVARPPAGCLLLGPLSARPAVLWPRCL